MDNSVLTVIISIVLGCFALWVLFYAYQLNKEEQQRCAEAGGHIISKGTVGFGPTFYGGQTGVATTYNSVTFCVSQDGKIIF